jgi:hypothetical protein
MGYLFWVMPTLLMLYSANQALHLLCTCHVNYPLTYAGQSAVASAFAFLSMVAFGICKPLTSAYDTYVYWFGSLIVFVSMFTTLLTQIDSNTVRDKVMGTVLIILCVVMLLSTAVYMYKSY